MAKSKFNEFMLELEAEAEGPEAVEELEAFRDYFRLAKELTLARKKLGLSQDQLAKKCGINQSEISDIERGRANPTFRTLQALARGVEKRVGLVTAPRSAGRSSRASRPRGDRSAVRR